MKTRILAHILAFAMVFVGLQAIAYLYNNPIPRQATLKTAPVAVKPPRSIPVPQKLADDYRAMVQSEQQALETAMQTPQWKDYQILQQQRLKQEAIIASELGCPASKARIPRDPQGRILTNADGRIERIDCADAKE